MQNEGKKQEVENDLKSLRKLWGTQGKKANGPEGKYILFGTDKPNILWKLCLKFYSNNIYLATCHFILAVKFVNCN